LSAISYVDSDSDSEHAKVVTVCLHFLTCSFCHHMWTGLWANPDFFCSGLKQPEHEADCDVWKVLSLTGDGTCKAFVPKFYIFRQKRYASYDIYSIIIQHIPFKMKS